MNRHNCVSLIVCIGLIFISNISLGQNKGRLLKSSVSKETGRYKYLKFDTKAESVSATEVNEVLHERLSVNNENDFKAIKSYTDSRGRVHTRYQQFYKGILVEDAIYNVHTVAGKVSAMNGDYQVLEGVDVNPSLSGEQAFKKAVDFVGAKSYLWDEHDQANAIGYEKPEGDLVIVKDELAYKYDIYSYQPLGRLYVFVSAKTGEIIKSKPIIHHVAEEGTAHTRYSGVRSIQTDRFSGNSYRLRDNTRGEGIETYDMNGGANFDQASDFVDNDNSWEEDEWNNESKDNGALDAHWAAGQTYDYFLNTFNRKSYDDNGGAIRNYVHFDLKELGYADNNNAFWDGSRVLYGTGDLPYTVMDVVAHEIGHGINDHTAELNSTGETGALNEGFSDIWAACVERYAAPEKQNWLVGEDLGKARRSLIDPKSNEQPDTYHGAFWVTGSSSDNGGIHTNCTVLGHWFYILAEGKKGTNDNGNNYDVEGIGIEKAAEIAYLLEVAYLTPNSGFLEARNYGIEAAKSLFGEDSEEAIATQSAWYAVGVGVDYPDGDSMGCVKGTVTLTITMDDHPEEISWSLKNSDSKVVDSEANYENLEAGAVVTKTFNLEDGEYDLIIKDEYGDGICCSHGNGSFTLKDDSTNITIGGGSEFEYTSVIEFCVGKGKVDVDPPSKPGLVTVNNITAESAHVRWVTATDNVGVSGYEVYLNDELKTFTKERSYSLKELTAGTSYQVSVRAKDKAGNTSEAGVSQFTTLEDISFYCSARGNNVSYEWIDHVQLDSINNKTLSDNGYGNFTDQTTTLSKGSAYTIYFSAGFKSSAYKEFWGIWIDFNQDGKFNAEGEQIVTGSSSASGVLSSEFVIPDSALTGTTRMRVAMKYNSAPEPCESFEFGEVEDYSVNIIDGLLAFTPVGVESSKSLEYEEIKREISLSPNPVKDRLHIALPDQMEVLEIRLTSLNGKEVRNVEIDKERREINMSTLPQGVYIILVQTERYKIMEKVIKE
ncbi:M4 family metallopeptidase [Fulvivirga sediminis]|uniref:M4 family metallopeptidase n=1 Tax=Fulvivirga sediminis TaxID=2803949 RepID=A0A937F8E6_9BACT|nr:M4 family metallopeptidase [Fulvivirga sediminis]MBL3657046.1 M4 family metallopeptidase [Fulvivirga sediminis]